jgi:hypothetical protein
MSISCGTMSLRGQLLHCRGHILSLVYFDSGLIIHNTFKSQMIPIFTDGPSIPCRFRFWPLIIIFISFIDISPVKCVSFLLILCTVNTNTYWCASVCPPPPHVLSRKLLNSLGWNFILRTHTASYGTTGLLVHISQIP